MFNQVSCVDLTQLPMTTLSITFLGEQGTGPKAQGQALQRHRARPCLLFCLHDDDMPAEVDFSKGARGKFYHPGAKFNLPVYLDDQVQTRLTALASRQGGRSVDIGQ